MAAFGPASIFYCTSSTRPSSPFTGQIAWETDTLSLVQYTGSVWTRIGGHGAWTDFTPTLTQIATVTKTVTYARWMRIGRLITAQCVLTITNAGTAGNPVAVGIPIAPAVTVGNQVIGSFSYQDSGTAIYSGAAIMASATTVSGQAYNTGAYIGQQPSFTTANTDIVSYAITYEAAAD